MHVKIHVFMFVRMYTRMYLYACMHVNMPLCMYDIKKDLIGL